jgi:hypothetical protein
MKKQGFSIKNILIIVNLCLLLWVFPPAVFPGDELSDALFTDAGSGLDQAVGHEPQVIRKRLVAVNFNRLCKLEKGVYRQEETPPLLGLNLFEDINFKARFHRVDQVFSGGFSCIGDIEGIPGSEVIFVVTGDLVSANISVPGHFYQVRFESGGVYKVQEVDQSGFPSELPPTPVQLEEITEPDNISADSGAYIDVLVVYTATACSTVGGTAVMENLIDLAVTESNTGYSNSGVSQRLRLVHTAEVDYNESGFNWSTTLSRLKQESDGYMDDVHTLRDLYGADGVVLIVDNTSSCGITYMMKPASSTFAPWAFSVVSRKCATGYYTFAHELGHNMGSAHDRDNAGVLGAYDYSYGYQAPDEAFRTVMSYNCPGGCSRVNYWSNPDKQYGGQPTGVVYTDPLAADNRKTLNETAYTVANFRQSAASPSVTVTSPNGGESLTVGTTHTITWASTGNVENVKIEYYNENDISGVTIVSSTANDGSYDWTVPDDVSSLNAVRISVAEEDSIDDYSNGMFSIVSAGGPTITVTSPNGSETWAVGSTQTITWTSTGTVGNVKIQYFNENFLSGVTIAASTANDGSYSWTVPDDISSYNFVKISEASDSDPQDSSDDNFSIVSAPTPTITVTSPNGGESLTAGSVQAITWTGTGTVGDVKIQYSANNGSSWNTITSSTANDGTHNWTVPNVNSSQCLVKVSEASDGSPSDTSNAVFSVANAVSPTITVTSPNGGESLTAGSVQGITWTGTGTVGNVKIQYSANNGSTWSTITSSTANDGSHDWTVPHVNSSQCLVKVSEASDGSPSDTSNAVFSIAIPVTPTITVTSPNGGENLEAGSSHTITWTGTGTVGNVKIEYSTNNGSSWSTIKSPTPNDGSYTWKIPAGDSSECKVRISEAADGSPSDTSDAKFTIYSPTPPEIALSRTRLVFGADTSGTATSSQSLFIDFNGGGTLDWSTGSDASWLDVTPGSGSDSGVITISVEPSGLGAGTYTGAVTVTAPGATNSPRQVTVTLKVYPAGTATVPFGEFATPANGAGVKGSIAVTGWVLDDIEVVSVKIYNGPDFVGDAVLVEGARPDVEQAYLDYPKNYQAGWGYMMLTNFLPNGGNGNYTIFAKAVDAEGNQVTLGSKTITIDNANAEKPFGAIDTPGQGGAASGSNFVNWGWVLTPQPNKIPTNGSTIKVYVDGVNLGNPKYNVHRSDLASLFPGYANSDGAAGYFYLDTTAYENGIHTIQWTAADDAGNTDGIGSRYFIIQNTGSDQKDKGQSRLLGKPLSQIPVPFDYSTDEPIRVKKGYDKNIPPQVIYPDEDGVINIETGELERVEIHFSKPTSNISRLPVGSTLDIGNGIFYWQPGPGFIGNYHLVFGDTQQESQQRVNIEILPFAIR